jgi:hypothetical protein
MLWTASCQYNPYASEFTRVEPDIKQIPGKYLLTQESKQLLVKLGVVVPRDAFVELQSDGHFLISALPDVSDGTPSQIRCYGSGKWRLHKFDSYQISFDFVDGYSTPGGKPIKESYLPAYFHLVGERAPYVLHVTVGDPDFGQALQFAK